MCSSAEDSMYACMDYTALRVGGDLIFQLMFSGHFVLGGHPLPLLLSQHI